MKEYKYVSERISYAPGNNKEEAINDESLEYLQTIINGVPPNNYMIILSNHEVQIGKDIIPGMK